jgi:hypothetical protein
VDRSHLRGNLGVGVFLFGASLRSGQWTVDSGQWTVDSGQWTVDSDFLRATHGVFVWNDPSSWGKVGGWDFYVLGRAFCEDLQGIEGE